MRYTRKYSILIVDDSREYIDAFIYQLNEIINGDLTRLDTANNGEEALTFVKTHHYDVIFMDINMPVMDGITATRHINKLFPHTKIIALSFHCEFEYLQRILEAGARNYLIKEEVNDENLIRILDIEYARNIS